MAITCAGTRSSRNGSMITSSNAYCTTNHSLDLCDNQVQMQQLSTVSSTAQDVEGRSLLTTLQIAETCIVLKNMIHENSCANIWNY